MSQSFEQLYQAWHRQMLFVAERILQDTYLAEDAVQNALLRISRQMHCLPENEKALRAYVLTSAKHAALDLLPQKQRDTDIDTLILTDHHNLFDEIAASEDYERLIKAISALPELYRDVLMLRYVQELKVGQIARLLGKTKSTVSKQLQRAKALLEKNYLKEDHK